GAEANGTRLVDTRAQSADRTPGPFLSHVAGAHRRSLSRVAHKNRLFPVAGRADTAPRLPGEETQQFYPGVGVPPQRDPGERTPLRLSGASRVLQRRDAPEPGWSGKVFSHARRRSCPHTGPSG